MTKRLLLLAATFVLGVAPLAAAPPSSPPGSVDEQLLLLGRDYPGFGGIFLDASGEAAVYLRDPDRQAPPLLKALGAAARVLRGDYEFSELLGWRYAMRPLLGVPGVTTLDVDETRNRVVLGIEPGLPAGDRERLALEIAARDVPDGAVLIEEQPGVTELVTLQSKFRPSVGGIQILHPLDPPTYSVCTLGFNATRGTVKGFVVNAHCTNVRGEIDGVVFSQSLPWDGDIGREVDDPPFFTGAPCPEGRRCRFSDSAFARYDNPKTSGLGKIAKPTRQTTDPPTLTVNPAAARFVVIGPGGSPLVGSLVHKVGRTTGWSVGSVRQTCSDTNVSNSDVTQLCQTRVTADGGPGDSGSPVFVRVGATTKVKLIGILWGGGASSSGETQYIFSPLSNIQQELGALKVN
jgi:hypothetical protein